MSAPSHDLTSTSAMWRMARQAIAGREPSAGRMIDELRNRYSPPVLAYILRSGYPQEEAEELLQSFFHHLQTSDAVLPTAPKLRHYLLVALKSFLIQQRPHDASTKLPSAEPAALSTEPEGGITAAAAFESKWSSTLVAAAKGEFRASFEASGPPGLFTALEPFLTETSSHGTLAEWSDRLNRPLETLKSDLTRMRAHLASLIREQVAATLSDPTPENIDEELSELRSSLATQKAWPAVDLSLWKPPTPEALESMLPRYRVYEFIGRGAISAVYRGEHETLGRVVAIKVLPSWLRESDPGFARRFLQDARVMAQLCHPDSVTVYDYGQTQGGDFYLVMEYIEGTDVASMLAQQGRFLQAHVLSIAIHVCDALQYAHERSIIHRDIRPANILVGQDGRVKLADFGNAASLNLLRQQPARIGAGPLTEDLLFTAPEALASSWQVDHRADIYSVGALLYVMLIGRRPQGILVMPSRLVPDLDPRLDRIISHAMRENREERYQNIFELRRDLESVLAGPQAHAPASQIGPLPKTRMLEDRSPPWGTGTDTLGTGSTRDSATRSAPADTCIPPSGQPPPPGPPPGGPDADPPASYPPENVQFTLFRPRTLTHDTWKKMLVYTHLDDGPPDHPTPLEQVRAEAARLLQTQAQDYSEHTKDSRHHIPREAEIRFIPHAPGVRFNPPVRQFFWTQGTDLHREEFDVCATADAAPPISQLSGTLTVYLGVLIVAELPLRFQLVAQDTPQTCADAERYTARPYRNIFPSYSRRDDLVVRQLESYALTLGDRFLKDVTMLRSGEHWSPRLLELIQQADVFQLFWSERSAQSPEVAKEWRHALLQQRSHFVRPTYWEDPMPPPPAEMSRIHFQRLTLPPVTLDNTSRPAPESAVAPEPSIQPSIRSRTSGEKDTVAASANDQSLCTKTDEQANQPEFSKTGFGAMGDITVTNDVLNTYHYSEDKSLNTTTDSGHVPSAARTFVVGGILCGFFIALVGLLIWSLSSSPYHPKNSALPPAIPAPTPTIDNSNPENVPQIISAELGVVAQGRFIPRTEFSSGDLLSIRLRLSRDGYLRIIYDSGKEYLVLNLSQTDGEFPLVKGNTEIIVPDPAKPQSTTEGEIVLKLFHDTGNGQPVRDTVYIQASAQPFTREGTTFTPDSPYPTIRAADLSAVLISGVPALRDWPPGKAMEKMHDVVAQRKLVLLIRP